jgi:translocation and assembly module TamB
VLDLRGVSVHVNLPKLGWTAVFGRGPLRLDLRKIELFYADVLLEEDSNRQLTLISAFEPRQVKPPSAPESTMALTIGEIAIRHAWLHGGLQALSPIDAELGAARARLAFDERGTELMIERARIVGRALPRQANPNGALQAKLWIPGAAAGSLSARAAFDGRIGQVPVRAQGSLDQQFVSGELVIPRTDAARFRPFLPGLTVTAPISARVQARGKLPHLTAEAHLKLGGAALDVRIRAQTAPLSIQSSLALRHFDARAIAIQAPHTDLSLTGEVSVAKAEAGSLAGHYELASESTIVEQYRVPALRLTGDFSESAATARVVSRESDIQTDIALSLRPADRAERPDLAEFSVDVVVPRLEKVAAHAGLQGALQCHVKGRYELARSQLSLNGQAALERVRFGTGSLERGTIAVRLTGAMPAPELVAVGELKSVTIAEQQIVQASFRAHGPLRSPRASVEVERADGLRIKASSVLAQGSLMVRDLNVTASRGEAQMQARARSIRIAESGVRLKDVELSATIARAGRAELAAADLELRQGPPHQPALERLRGELFVDTEFDLEQLARAVPKEYLPVDHAAGKLKLTGSVRRSAADRLPHVDLTIATERLELVGKGSRAAIDDRKQAKQQQAWRTKDVDAMLALSIDGASGAAELDAEAHDARGALVAAWARAILPKTALEARGPALVRLLSELPFSAEVSVPERQLGQLPVVVRPAGVVGSIEASFKARGNARAPNIELWVRGRRLRSKDPSEPIPVDVNASATYENDHTHIAVDAYRDGRGSLALRSEALGNLLRLAETRDPAQAGMRAKASLHLTSFPLRTVPIFKERLINGDVSGNFVLTGLGENPTLRSELRVEHLELGSVPCQTARLDLEAKDGRLSSNLELLHGDGFLRAKLASGIAWKRNWVPALDDAAETRTQLLARDFRVGTLQPFVAEQVSTIDGRMNAQLESWSAAGRTTISGRAELRDGILQIPAIGQEFRDIRAQVTASKGGVVKLEDAQARGRQGRVRIAAAARLAGVSVRAARVRVAIAEDERLPLTTQGVELGEAWGTLDATLLASPAAKTTTIDVYSPDFHLELPQTKQHKIQPLEEPDNVRVGVRLDPRTFHALPLQPLEEPSEPSDSRTIINVALGRDVWVRQGTSMRAQLGGKLRLELSGATSVSGRIRLVGGRLDVSGKRFEIERGLVTFQGTDPANPIVVATARHDSRDAEGYRVYADFVGPVKTGKLTLRSEPPLSEDEILSLLLFGETDGSFGSGAGGSAATAVSVGGSSATRGLNAALEDLTDLDVSTRVDTSRGSPTPELVIQLSRRLAAQVGYNLGTPGLGQAPDRTFITLDLRIRRRWSLATTVGDHGGTMVDAVWRHRY